MIENRIEKNVPLSPLTTFKIGGPARYFLKVKNQDEIIKAVKWAKEKNIPYFILGGGSNILVSDKGFNGLVINLNFSKKIKILSRINPDNILLLVGAGISLQTLVNFCIKNNFSGLEWGIGIPGTVGGALRGNAGAYGHSISSVVKFIKILRNGSIQRLINKHIKFSYRSSIFQQNNDIILEAVLKFKKGVGRKEKKIIEYGLKHRANTQPYGHSPGCIFKNVDMSKFSTRFLKNDADIKKFKNNQQIPAGWLIEKCGLKGKQIGGAEISKKHANFIVNKESATADNVVVLISIIKSKVRNKFNIQLNEEVGYIGF